MADHVRTDWRRILKQLSRPEDPDAMLLRRFIEQRDAEAFAEIVRRYEGLVWSQCRHLLRNDTDADDAFQATFLALIRSAKKIRQTDQLGPWLYGVSYRVCLNARRTAAQRARRERCAAVAEAGQPVADAAWDETLAAIHQAVNQLPEKLRVPFVLCYLQGKSTTAAASELGLKFGTFSARLSRAKKLVLAHLAKRGGATVAAMASVAGATASAPPRLINRVVEFSTSNITVVPNDLLVLSQGVTHMGVSKFKLLAAGAVLAASLLAGTYGFWPVKAQAPGTPGAAAPAGYPGAPAPALRPAPGSDPFPYPGMPQQNPPAFEYKVVELRGRADATQKELNRYGNEGWELVSVTANIQNGPELKTAYLKRKKTSVPIGPGMPGVGLFPPGGGPPSVPGIPGGGPMPPALPAGSGPGIGGPMPPAAGGGGLLAPSSGAPSVGGGIPAATPGVGGVPNDPTRGTNLVRSRATVDEVSKSWITTEQGANFAINAATRYFKKDRQGKLAPAGQSDLKPGGSIEIYFDKNARVVARIIVE